MVDKDTIVKPNKITDEDLLRVHTEDYLNSLKVKI
jgi:acetoin utilization deacetylase AcuC-like enzyme